MTRSALVLVLPLPIGIAFGVGCTLDFDQFAVIGAGGASPSGSTGSASAGSGGMMSAVGSGVTVSSNSSVSASSTESVSTSASSGTGGGMPAPETNCTNGVDDDKNGLTDCADPNCAAFACIENVPAGWNGPVALYDGALAAEPSCASGPFMTKVYEGHADLSPDPATCSKCDCTPPMNTTCVAAALNLASDAACSIPTGNVVQPAPGQCGPIAPPMTTKAYTAKAPAASSANCTPTGGAATVPPPNWQTAGLACGGGGLGLGCAANQSCAPKAEAPFESTLCVWKSGDHQCPMGYETMHSFFDQVVDSRHCSTCTCGAPDAVCTAKTTVFANGNCTGASFDVADDGSCVSGAIGGSIKIAESGMTSCVPDGGQPIGMIAAGPLETTVCCAP